MNRFSSHEHKESIQNEWKSVEKNYSTRGVKGRIISLYTFHKETSYTHLVILFEYIYYLFIFE